MSEDTLQARALADRMRECPQTEKEIMECAENLLQVHDKDKDKEAELRNKYEKKLFETASRALGQPVTSVQVVNEAYMLLTPASSYDALGE